MQNIPCGLTPAELPAREQSHEQNSDFTNTINIFSGRQSRKSKNFFTFVGRALGSCLVVVKC
jgi:hypothetical protein